METARDGRIVARRGTYQGRAADVDHLDGLVERHRALADLWCEGLDVDHDKVDQADAAPRQLLKLVRHLAAREDAGVDVGVEGPDLATGQ